MSGRLRGPDREALSAEQAEVSLMIEEGPRGQVAGPPAVWLHSPGPARHAQALGAHARHEAPPARLSKPAILVTARIWSSGHEWANRAPIARAAGWGEAVVDAIPHARRPALPDPGSRPAPGCAVEIHRDRAPGDAACARGTAALGPRGMADLVGLCAHCGLFSMTIDAFEVPLGEGPAPPRLSIPVVRCFRGAAPSGRGRLARGRARAGQLLASGGRASHGRIGDHPGGLPRRRSGARAGRSR